MDKLNGRVALITGGARGIGKAIAERCIAEGASLALCDIDRESVEATATAFSERGSVARGYVMNVADESSVIQAVTAIEKDFGKIDILVNNAGITRDGLLIRMKKDDWDAVLAVNLTGAFNVSKAVVKTMMKARYGRIVNIASVVGVIGNVGQVNYSASKAGLIGLTKSMAKELASRNITVNALAPGFIETEMTQHLSDQAKEEFLRLTPLNRPGTMDDVARAVMFLASDDASYITGQVVCIDGGMVM